MPRRFENERETREKTAFYRTMLSAFNLLGTWVLVGRYLGQSYATVMRWSAEAHAPAKEKRAVLTSQVVALRQMDDAERDALRDRLTTF